MWLGGLQDGRSTGRRREGDRCRSRARLALVAGTAGSDVSDNIRRVFSHRTELRWLPPKPSTRQLQFYSAIASAEGRLWRFALCPRSIIGLLLVCRAFQRHNSW